MKWVSNPKWTPGRQVSKLVDGRRIYGVVTKETQYTATITSGGREYIIDKDTGKPIWRPFKIPWE